MFKRYRKVITPYENGVVSLFDQCLPSYKLIIPICNEIISVNSKGSSMSRNILSTYNEVYLYIFMSCLYKFKLHIYT